ncbi:SCO5389 family protein [Planosporangium sp. 12N6]|uniref:SCO5389 family protein n=1 Tax=Planosporangium spinosum TaxID=3402278 RepID=UPI003CF435C2
MQPAWTRGPRVGRLADVPVESSAAVGHPPLWTTRARPPSGRTIITTVVADLRRHGGAFAEHAVPPPSEHARGQLLRALASDAIRGGLERHFGVKLAFQNCHRVAAFAPSAVDGTDYRGFVSPCGQLLNQSTGLRDC